MAKTIPEPMLWLQVRNSSATPWADWLGVPTSMEAAFTRVRESAQFERARRGDENVRVVIKHIEILDL